MQSAMPTVQQLLWTDLFSVIQLNPARNVQGFFCLKIVWLNTPFYVFADFFKLISAIYQEQN